jgi:hypothetical protein
MAKERTSEKMQDRLDQVERVMSPDEPTKSHADHERIDPEVAKYASTFKIEITPEDNKRLKRMIDRRVLAVMIFTYFLQALDKGTLSFASIMHLREDLGLHGQQVRTMVQWTSMAIG